MDPFFDIVALIQAAGYTCYPGYAVSKAQLPYSVARTLTLDEEVGSIAGVAINWDKQYTIYACAASVEASQNFAVLIMRALHGARVGNDVLSTSMGYVGAPVEGHYESQVTVQLNQGGI